MGIQEQNLNLTTEVVWGADGKEERTVWGMDRRVTSKKRWRPVRMEISLLALCWRVYIKQRMDRGDFSGEGR